MERERRRMERKVAQLKRSIVQVAFVSSRRVREERTQVVVTNVKLPLLTSVEIDSFHQLAV